MTYSLNELEGLINKAAVGAGLPPGHGAAISAAGIWLARRQFPVCEIVAHSLALETTGPGNFSRVASTVRFQDARAAWDGVAAIDLLLANPAGFKVKLHQLDEPLLLLGLAGAAADAFGGGIIIAQGTATVALGAQAQVTYGDVALAGPSDIDIERASELPSGLADELATRYDPEQTRDTGWQQLMRLAHKTYVPASEQSRLRGAGAGLIDTD